MSVNTVKHQIAFITHSPQERTNLLARLNAQTELEIMLYDSTDAMGENPRHAWDVILVDVPSDEQTAPVLEAVQRLQPGVPLITLLDKPTVNQAVDLMRAGIRGVVDSHDPDRIVEIIHQELISAPAHEQLESHPAQLNAMLDTIQDALIAVSLPEREVLFVSDAFEAVFGYPYQYFIENDDFFRRVVHPDDLERTIQSMKDCLVKGVAELDHRIIWPDGQVRWIHRRAWVKYDSEGQPICINDSARDITERKRIENELRAHEEQLRSLIDSQTSYMLRTDLQGCYTYWNPKFEQEFGWLHEAEGLLGAGSLSSICTHHHERTVNTVKLCLAQPGVPFQVELDKPGRDGTIRTTLWEFICLTDAQGSPAEMQCVGIDITAQKQAQAVIEYQASLMQHVSDAVIATNNDLVITSWNRAATDIYGWTADEAVGQPLDELLKTEWIADTQIDAQAELTRTGQWRGEIRQMDKAGVSHYVVAAVNLLHNDQGVPIGGVTVNRDITLEKRREILQQRTSVALEAIAQGQALKATLDDLTRAIEEFSPDIKASVLLLDARTNQLRHGAAPSLPQSYTDAIDGVTIGTGVGSCGTAAFEKRLVIVDDIATNPLWKDYKDLAAAHGLKACWSQPVMNQTGEVLATFAMYYEMIRHPTAAELDLIWLAAHIAGLAIEHAHAGEALQRSEIRYRQMFERVNLPKFILDPYTARILDANPAAEVFYGYPLSTLKTMTMMHINLAERQVILDKMVEVLQGETDSCFFDQRLANGTQREVEGFVVSIEHNGQPALYCTYIDVTERNRAQAALQQANLALEHRVQERTEALEQAKNRIEAIFNHSGDGILLLSTDLNIEQGNHTFNQMFAVEVDAYVGQPLTAFIPDSDHAQLRTIIDDVVMLHKTHRMEIQVRRSDGSLFDAEISVAPINRASTAVENVVCIIRDVSERKRAQQAIAEERNLLRTVIDAVPDFIYVKDLNHRIILNNAAHAAFLGSLVTDNSEGKTYLEILPADVAAGILKEEARILATGEPSHQVENRVHYSNGNPLWTMTTKVPLRNLDEEMIGLVGITHNISNIKANEEALRASEEKFRMFIESAPIATIISDHAGQIVLLNRAAERLFGYTRDELIGTSIQALVPVHLRTEHNPQSSQWNYDQHRQRSDAMEVFAQRKNGQIFPADVQLSQVSVEPESLTMSFVMDITRRKQAEETLRMALEKEKELGELKSRFISMASHQFRTPLAAILASTESLTIYLDRMDSNQIDMRLDRIRKQVMYMKNIMDDVLELARIQADQVRYQPVEGDLDALCKEIIEDFTHQGGYRDRVIYNGPSTPLMTSFDPHLMHHLVNNLIHNALKYSMDDQPVYVNLSYAQDHILLTVQDTGIGIPPQDIKHLFDPFFRATNVGTIAGTGLGLSIAKQAVDAHRGSIAIETTPDIGTTFVVTLPNRV
ncbi:MAG: hypothetical protein OHK0046_18300 [Anaerolineae bacterium]